MLLQLNQCSIGQSNSSISWYSHNKGHSIFLKISKHVWYSKCSIERCKIELYILIYNVGNQFLSDCYFRFISSLANHFFLNPKIKTQWNGHISISKCCIYRNQTTL